MKLLLDTNALLWMRSDSPKLTAPQRSAISGADSVRVSIVTAWELAILARLNRIRIDTTISETTRGPGLELLDLRLDHIERVAELPLLHRDPFDRMLIAQALVEDCSVVTSDGRFAPYGVQVIGPGG